MTVAETELTVGFETAPGEETRIGSKNRSDFQKLYAETTLHSPRPVRAACPKASSDRAGVSARLPEDVYGTPAIGEIAPSAKITGEPLNDFA